MAKERVQKILAKAGIASRRKAEDLIREGSVTINGKVAILGSLAEWRKDSIKVRGKLLHEQEAKSYFLFYKPKGVLSVFEDAEGRPTLAEFFKRVKVRLFPLGRLDFNTEGLLLLTNDGDLAEKVQKHSELLRIYHVKVKGHVLEEKIKSLEKGAKMGDRLFRPQSVKIAQLLKSKSVIEIAVKGSGSVDLKQYFEFKGFLVDRLVRIKIGHLDLDGLRPGSCRLLKESHMRALLSTP